MPIYRRGAVYWWRRNLPSRLDGVRPITLRLSLKTTSAHTAKTRAATLELEWDKVIAIVAETLRPNPTREDLASVYRQAFTIELDRIVVKQAAQPWLADTHAVSNRVHAQLFTMFTRSPWPPVPDAAFLEELIAAGLDRDEAEKVHVTLQMYQRRQSFVSSDVYGDGREETPDIEAELRDLSDRQAALIRLRVSTGPIGAAHVGAYLREAGVRPTSSNIAATVPTVAAAYRSACLRASHAIGRPVSPGTVLPLPLSLLELLGVEVPDGDYQEVRSSLPVSEPKTVLGRQPATAPAIPRTLPSASPAAEPSSPQVSGSDPADMPISAVATAAVRARVAAREWEPERARDIDAVVKLFVAANGDIPFATVRQHHVAAMVASFSCLPVRYGFARNDRATGLPSQETIAEALARGSELRKRWDENRVKAEDDGLPQVGLSLVTHNKHLTWFGALITYAEATGLPFPSGLNLTILRIKATKARRGGGSGMAKKNEALPAFSAADLRHLLSAPIWTGCAGLWQRFEPGNVVIHDAFYWCPLIIALHGCRSDEGCGVALADIEIDVAIPFIHFRANAFRRVKTAASDRKVPIHPLITALGFLDYVRAMRALGHEAAFPELLHPTLGFDHNFYDKVFEPLRALQFPNGTSRKRGRKDCDVRSIRSRVVSHLRDVCCPKELTQAIVGHEVGDVTSDIYEEDPDLALLLPWITKLGDLVPHIVVQPLNLRPREWQRFGSPRGRRRKP